MNHEVRGVLLFAYYSSVWIVLIELELWVADHCCLHVETAVAEEDHDVASLLPYWKCWGCAAKNFASRSWFLLWNYDIFKSLFDESLLCDKQRVVELNGGHQVKCFLFELCKVKGTSLNKVFDIDLDLNKDIQDLPPGLSNGHKARMSIMNQEITVHKIRGDVIDTTRAIRHIAHDNDVEMDLIDLETEGFEDISDDAGV